MSVREIIETAGAEFIGVEGVCVLFRDPETHERLSLYLKACSLENVGLSLKASRERVLSFAPWLPQEVAAR